MTLRETYTLRCGFLRWEAWAEFEDHPRYYIGRALTRWGARRLARRYEQRRLRR